MNRLGPCSKCQDSPATVYPRNVPLCKMCQLEAAGLTPAKHKPQPARRVPLGEETPYRVHRPQDTRRIR